MTLTSIWMNHVDATLVSCAGEHSLEGYYTDPNHIRYRIMHRRLNIY